MTRRRKDFLLFVSIADAASSRPPSGLTRKAYASGMIWGPSLSRPWSRSISGGAPTQSPKRVNSEHWRHGRRLLQGGRLLDSRVGTAEQRLLFTTCAGGTNFRPEPRALRANSNARFRRDFGMLPGGLPNRLPMGAPGAEPPGASQCVIASCAHARGGSRGQSPNLFGPGETLVARDTFSALPHG